MFYSVSETQMNVAESVVKLNPGIQVQEYYYYTVRKVVIIFLLLISKSLRQKLKLMFSQCHSLRNHPSYNVPT